MHSYEVVKHPGRNNPLACRDEDRGTPRIRIRHVRDMYVTSFKPEEYTLFISWLMMSYNEFSYPKVISTYVFVMSVSC